MAANLSPETLKDLEASGLTNGVVSSSGIKDEVTDEAVGTLLRDKYHVKGYVLPYHGLDRRPLNFYRVKVLSSLNGAKPPKYLQPKAYGNHLYVAPSLHEILPTWAADTTLPLYITEGEKKALAGIQAGIPTLAVGGVYSWRTHIHTIDRGMLRVEDKPSSRVVHLDDRGEKAYRSEVAPELDGIEWSGRRVYLLFDSDASLNEEVQRAAFEFANYLDDRGAVTRQISLDGRIEGNAGRTKLGLDDLLVLDPTFGERLLDEDWLAAEGFRPLPSDPHTWVAEQLGSGRTTRPTQERVAALAISWLDANGKRFMGADGTYYYFDESTRVLHDFHPGTNLASLRETSFGHLLVEQLGLDPADSSTIGRMIGHYPIGASIISPYRVAAIEPPGNDDSVYYQFSDADVMRVTPEGLEVISNGDDDVLFYKGTVEPIDPETLSSACEEWKRPKVPLWYKALSTLNIDPLGDLSADDTLRLLTTLYYMSPWLNRWRGLMLPLEIAVGEPGSGKTFTYNLRKGILTGRASLSGLPDDFRSWVASVGAAPAMWICDNLGNVKSDYWHRLNDELARLITDPDPSIELRQLYTTATTLRVPINSTFAITTIRNPFTAPDILQRSLLYNLSAIPVGKRDPDWYQDRMDARVFWLAEHLNFLQLFLAEASKAWKPNYKSGYRLVHFEQAALIMGRVLGWDLTKVVGQLAGVVSATVAKYDPVIEGLTTFVEEWSNEHPKRTYARLQEIVDWVEEDMGERFISLRQFANEITLARYIDAHKYDIEQSLGCKLGRVKNDTVLELP